MHERIEIVRPPMVVARWAFCVFVSFLFLVFLVDENFRSPDTSCVLFPLDRYGSSISTRPWWWQSWPLQTCNRWQRRQTSGKWFLWPRRTTICAHRECRNKNIRWYIGTSSYRTMKCIGLGFRRWHSYKHRSHFHNAHHSFRMDNDNSWSPQCHCKCHRKDNWTRLDRYGCRSHNYNRCSRKHSGTCIRMADWCWSSRSLSSGMAEPLNTRLLTGCIADRCACHCKPEQQRMDLAWVLSSIYKK